MWSILRIIRQTLRHQYHNLRKNRFFATTKKLVRKALRIIWQVLARQYHHCQRNCDLEATKKLIRKSGLFDDQWYATNYPDAHTWTGDLLDHFLHSDLRELRDPGPLFDTRYYTTRCPTVLTLGITALEHYILIGRAKNFMCKRTHPTAPFACAPSDEAWSELERRVRLLPDDRPQVDVVVPVYKGYRETAGCLYSVLCGRCTCVTPHQVIVVDDCSPDSNVTSLLDDLASRGLIILLRNEKNCGFVHSVNIGMSQDQSLDVVLLNSDTEVYGNWLDRLRDAAYSEPMIGTVTPFSNNATICSYPLFCEDYPKAIEIPFARLDELASEANAGRLIHIPTGVGFCMYIRRGCLQAVGLFDEQAFGRGYGEENDFCLRATASGWSHVLAPNIFVRHLGRVSFGNESEQRLQKALAVLNRRYPGYAKNIANFCHVDPALPLRRNLDVARLRHAAGPRSMLMISHDRGGGTQKHVDDMCRILREQGIETFIMKRQWNDTGVDIIHPNTGHLYNLKSIEPLRDFDTLVGIIQSIGIKHIHVHHLVDYGPLGADWIQELARRCELAYDFTAHDFFSVCPSINMIGRDGFYCAKIALEDCDRCLQKCPPDYGAISAWQWRQHFAPFLRKARRIFVPSENTKHHLLRFIPDLTIEVRKHPEPLPASFHEPLLRRSGEPLRVAVIGGIGPHKGSTVILACAKDALERGLPIRFVIVGTTDKTEMGRLKNVTITGPYHDNELGVTLDALRCHMAFFPSIWPETFCYTLSHAFNAGLFPVAFDLGAPADRIRNAGWGLVLDCDLHREPGRLNDILLKTAVPPIPAPHPSVREYQEYGDILRNYYCIENNLEEPVDRMSSQHTALAHLLNGHVRTVPCRYGPMATFDFDAVVGRALITYGEWGQNELDFLLPFIAPGMHILDGGAHAGYYTLAFVAAAGAQGRVLAVEPNPALVELLRRNTRHARAEVEVLHAGLGREAHSLCLGIVEPVLQNLGALSLEAQSRQGLDAEPVPVLPVDALGLTRLDFVKLDVEGLEASVLAGAQKTLAALQPLVYLECLTADTGWDCCQQLAPLGYTAYFCSFAVYNWENFRGVFENSFGDAQEAGLLLVPRRFAAVAEPALAARGFSAVLDKEGLSISLSGVRRYDYLSIEAFRSARLSEDVFLWAKEALEALHAARQEESLSLALRGRLDQLLAVRWMEHEHFARDMGLLQEILTLAQECGLYDEDYYLRAHPEVRTYSIAPFHFFMTSGWRLGHNPSEGFNVEDYLGRMAPRERKSVNPLLDAIFSSRGWTNQAPLFRVDQEQAFQNLQASPYSRWAARKREENTSPTYAANRIWKHPIEMGVVPKFRISKMEKVFAMGSCFAREIEDALKQQGVDVVTHCDELFSLPILSMGEQMRKQNKMMRPRAFTNRYNTMSLHRELERLLVDNPKVDDETLIYDVNQKRSSDLHYSQSLPQVSHEKSVERRTILKDYFGKSIRDCSVFIFTLGLAEVWYDVSSKMYLNNTPGAAVREKFKDKFEVHLTRYEQHVKALHELHELLTKNVGRDVRIVVTVSPVPLEATFFGQDIVQVNAYAKSMLRAAAQDFSAAHPNVDYFPSYEMVGYSPPNESWGWDYRHVSPAVVQNIVGTFLRHYLVQGSSQEG